MILSRHSGCRVDSLKTLAPMNSARAKASFFFSPWIAESLKPSKPIGLSAAGSWENLLRDAERKRYEDRAHRSLR